MAYMTVKCLNFVSSFILKPKFNRKHLLISCQVDVHIHVLLHELYPAKEASSNGPFDRNGRLSHQDFIMALQKIDLEGLADSAVEANLLFEANQLPLTDLTTEAVHSKCKPGSSSNYADFSIPTTSNRAVIPPDTTYFGGDQDEKLPEAPKVASSLKKEPLDSQTLSLPSTNLLNQGQSYNATVTDYEEDLCPNGHDPGVSYSEDDNTTVKIEQLACSPLTYLVEASSPSSLVSPSSQRWSPSSVDPSNDHLNRRVVSAMTYNKPAVILTKYPQIKVESCESKVYDAYLSNEGGIHCMNVSLKTEDETSAPLAPNSVSDNRQHSRRKTPLSTEVRHHNMSSSSELDICDGGMLAQVGCSSDSEVDYRSDRQTFGQLPTASNSFRACYTAPNDLTHLPVRRIEKAVSESELRGESPVRHSSTSLLGIWDFSDYSTAYSETSNRRDRHFRDAEALKAAGVPFTYNEVVYFSNEEFRELKNSPHLTQEQINVMLEARRRATNRQAAERCRRRKVAVRDEVSEQLARLKLQRKTLTQRLLQARRCHQETKDSFIAEQKRLLTVLRSSSGDKLEYSDWRVRLTKNDEVVVVAAGH